MRYIYNGVAPFTQKKAPSCTSFRVLRPYTHTGGGLTILESIAPSPLERANGLRGPRRQSTSWCAVAALLPGTSQNISPGLHYSTIIVYILYICAAIHLQACCCKWFRGILCKDNLQIVWDGGLMACTISLSLHGWIFHFPLNYTQGLAKSIKCLQEAPGCEL